MQGFNERFDGLERRIDRLERRLDESTALLSSRIDALDQKISRHFTWTVGMQVAVLLAVVAALAGR